MIKTLRKLMGKARGAAIAMVLEEHTMGINDEPRVGRGEDTCGTFFLATHVLQIEDGCVAGNLARSAETCDRYPMDII
jgi:hypothetical protein